VVDVEGEVRSVGTGPAAGSQDLVQRLAGRRARTQYPGRDAELEGDDTVDASTTTGATLPRFRSGLPARTCTRRTDGPARALRYMA